MTEIVQPELILPVAFPLRAKLNFLSSARACSVTHSGAKMNSKVESSDSDLRSFVSQFNLERPGRKSVRASASGGEGERSGTVKKALK